MHFELDVNSKLDKKDLYSSLIPQIENLIADENNFISNAANVMAVLKTTFDFHWVGCYLIEDKQLVLGPFQGPLACTRIDLGKGVCGKAWEAREIIVVPDVSEFDGHIACSYETKSEIVLPIIQSNSEIIGVLDVDSKDIEAFDLIDVEYLGKIADLLGKKYA